MPRIPRKGPHRRSPVLMSTEQRPIETVSLRDQMPVVGLKTSTLNPNLFRKRLGSVPHDVQPGDLVAVDLENGTRIGFGLFNPVSEIAVRMLSSDDVFPDELHWRSRMERALELRVSALRLPSVADVYRVVHAEGDGLPGLVIDRYGDVLSVEAFSLGMYQRAVAGVKLLAELCGTRHYVIRTGPYSQEQEGFDAEPIRSPGCPGQVVVQEYGTRFRIQFDGGHKTGFFCDQRENRHQLAAFCEGKAVLDLCCYTGGFAVQAKKLGKAGDVTAVELDEEPLRLARENANLNQVRINFVHADVFPYMRDMLRNGRQFDVVVLDPPKLIRSRDELEEGRRKHFDLNRLAMQLVKPGGLLLTCSCAGLLSNEDFERLLCSAARQAGEVLPADSAADRVRHGPREMQILFRTGAGPDHPIGGNCPESEYLKAYWLRML